MSEEYAELSVTDFAKRLGVSRQAVNNGLKKGRIKKEVGKNSGKDRLIWPKCRDEWNKNRVEHRVRNQDKEKIADEKRNNIKSNLDAMPADQILPEAPKTSENNFENSFDSLTDESSLLDKDGNADRNKADAWISYYKAKKAKLEYEEASGDLVRKEIVNRVVFSYGKELRQKLYNVLTSLPLLVAAESDPERCETLIKKEIDRINEGIVSDSLL